MGTHPIFESDFDCLTERLKRDRVSKMAFRGFKPLFDRVLVQRVAAETKTAGGILLPGEAKQLPIAKVLSVGTGLRMDSGDMRPLSVAVEDEFDLYRDAEFLG